MKNASYHKLCSVIYIYIVAQGVKYPNSWLLFPGYLSSSPPVQRGSVGTYKRDDELSKPAVCEAVEAFLSRSQADLGQALPLHVEESLGYLQDCLLEVCVC